MGRGRQIKQEKTQPVRAGSLKRLRVIPGHGTYIVAARLSRRLQLGRPSRRRAPDPPPKLRVPGDKAIRALFANRSYSSVARAADLSQGYLSKLVRGQAESPGLRTLERLAGVLGCQLVDLIGALRDLRPDQPSDSTPPRAHGFSSPSIFDSQSASPQTRRPARQSAPAPSAPPPGTLRPSLARLLAPPAPFVTRQPEPLTLQLAKRDYDDED